MRPPRPDIAAPPLPPEIEWLKGMPVPSMERLLAQRPALVHFFDIGQLNSIRTLPYLRAWHERYVDLGLAVLGVHSPRFPFSRDGDKVVHGMPSLEIKWPVALDPEMAIWRTYEPKGWPSLFLWGKGGALRWHHLGEGEYAATEEAIQDALDEAGSLASRRPPVEPTRPSDAPGAKVVPPTPELFPGGSIEEPWAATSGQRSLTLDYEAAGAYAATDGVGEIAVSKDGGPARTVEVLFPGLQTLAEADHHESHSLELTPSPGVQIYSLQFAPGPP
jgi:hypothetical protein